MSPITILLVLALAAGVGIYVASNEGRIKVPGWVSEAYLVLVISLFLLWVISILSSLF